MSITDKRHIVVHTVHCLTAISTDKLPLGPGGPGGPGDPGIPAPSGTDSPSFPVLYTVSSL